MAAPEELRLLSETRFDHRVPNGFPKSNPAADLSVSWDATGKNLLIFRPRDQVVSRIHQYAKPSTTAPEPQATTWKPDGQFLAVGWSDGQVRLMGLENNKTAHHIRITKDPTVKITHIGWSRNVVGKPEARNQQPRPDSLQHQLASGLELPGKPTVLDLPRELTFLEIETSLPKISTLPVGSAGAGDDAMVFTLQTGIEFLFQPFKVEESDQVHVMIIGTSDGRLHLSIYDSFIVGDFRYTLPASIYRPGVLQLVGHASTTTISTHSLVLRHPADENRAVYLVPMDLAFIASSPVNLALLASKLTTLQKLLRYVKQTQLHMSVEHKNTRELPTRFIRAVQEDLEKAERGPTDLVQALFHTVLTGHTYDMVKEWLVDNLAERGHKRWDKAVTLGLQNLRSLIHENFLPTLLRCSIILSRLRGLAQFYDTRDDIGFSVAQIARATEVVACLTLVGNRILLQVMEELDLFTAFSSWLRFQIDRLAASNSASEELTEKEATMDNAKVLAYIQKYLMASPSSLYFDEVSQEEHNADWETIEGGLGLVDVLDAQLKRSDEGQPHMKALPRVSFLVEYLDSRANAIFASIAEAQKRSVRFGQPSKIVLETEIVHMDTIMVSTNEKEKGSAKTYVAANQKDKENEVYIFRTSIRSINGISSTTSNNVAAFDLGDSRVVDLKFFNDTALVVLVIGPDSKHRVVQIPLESSSIPYSDYRESVPLSTQHLPDALVGERFAVHCLPEDPSFVPVKLEVHASTDIRGRLPARICLLGRDRTSLRVFTSEKDDKRGQAHGHQPYDETREATHAPSAH